MNSSRVEMSGFMAPLLTATPINARANVAWPALDILFLSVNVDITGGVNTATSKGVPFSIVRCKATAVSYLKLRTIPLERSKWGPSWSMTERAPTELIMISSAQRAMDGIVSVAMTEIKRMYI